MSSATDNTLRSLDACGGCEGTAVKTPVEIVNRAGLDAVAYRVGTHSRFKDSLLARLSVSDYAPLHGLTTREDRDFTIALLDAWSAVADVLTFYQERIANEAYLRTATERLSVIEMARLIGYQLDPGVSASAYLALEIESVAGAFGAALAAGGAVTAPAQEAPTIAVASGLKVQTIPEPGEEPQMFETVESIEAHPDHNAIPPRQTYPQKLTGFSQFANVVTPDFDLKQGDLALIVDGVGATFTKPTLKIITDDDRKTTQLNFAEKPVFPNFPDFSALKKTPGTIDLVEDDISMVDAIKDEILVRPWTTAELNALIELRHWDRSEFVRLLREQTKRTLAEMESAEVHVFRQRTRVFGYNAPPIVGYGADGKILHPDSWEEWDPLVSSPTAFNDEVNTKMFLSEANDKILAGSYIAVRIGSGNLNVYKVTEAKVRPRSAYNLSSDTTELDLDRKWWDVDDFADIRTATVYVQSEQLELAEFPIKVSVAVENTAAGNSIMLDRAYIGLRKGDKVVITGDRSDLEGVAGSELAVAKEVWIKGGLTELELDEKLEGAYHRSSVKIGANVAEATHGETTEEILGSGDSRQAFQRFDLKQLPLTYVSSASASGSSTTLEVRVNDLLWNEVPTFYGAQPEDRIFVTQLADDGKTTVIFGDGKTGARLPTGLANVRAKYRKGIGLGGLVKAGQIAQLMTRPLGVKSAINPLAPDGAEDADSLAQARSNAPITALTMDRIVSLRDFEDFSRDYAGIDKARATWFWTSTAQEADEDQKNSPLQKQKRTRNPVHPWKRSVFVTVAGAKGAEVNKDSTLLRNLVEAIKAHSDPHASFVVESYRSKLFRIAGTVTLEPDRLIETVEPVIEAKLRDQFSFDAREFGYPVALSEVITAIQEVDGVKWVDIDSFYDSEDDAPSLQSLLPAEFPSQGDMNLKAAQLLTLDPRPLELKVIL